MSKDLNSSVKIDKRENETGIVFTPEINSQQDIDLDCLYLIDGVEHLMKGFQQNDEEMQKIYNILNQYSINYFTKNKL